MSTSQPASPAVTESPPWRVGRRRFLQVGAAAGAGVGFAGASAISAVLSEVLAKWGEREGQPFQPPAAEEIDDVTHVLNRLTWGPRPGDWARVSAMGVEAFIEEQLAPESIDDRRLTAQLRHYEALDARPMGELLEYSPVELLDQLTRAKIKRAVASRRQLFEVMVDFWSDHFNIDPSKGDARWWKPADDRDVIRRHAMGRFVELLRATALSPSMLWYLDGRVNAVQRPEDRPNENYARELLELHTLSVHGGYTQQDVMEVARCLSGWTVRARREARFAAGRLEFVPQAHDDGPKQVLGVTIPAGLGAQDLDHVIEITAHHPATARHLAWKLCCRFIAEAPPESAVQEVAAAFQASGGDIRATLRVLFRTEAFWTARGNKFKRPFHFVVSALRATQARTDAGRAVQDYLLRMGHAPFQYPTPDGYPEEMEPWLATVLWRWRFALELTANALKGTTIQPSRLIRAAGGERALAAHFLGRQPREAEWEAAQASGAPLALWLVSPAFQTC